MESKRVELGPEPIGMMRKKRNARDYRALFKRQRLRFVPDGGEKIGGQDTLSILNLVCPDNRRDIGFTSMRIGEDHSIDKASDGALEESSFSLRGCRAAVDNDIIAHSSPGEKIVYKRRTMQSKPISCVGETLDKCGSLQTSCSSAVSIDACGISDCLAKLQEGSVRSGSHEKDKEKGHSTIVACNQYQNWRKESITSNNNVNCMSGEMSCCAELFAGLSEERVVSSDDQESRHIFLLWELTKLCKILKLPEDSTNILRRFLGHALNNYHVYSDSPSTLQAFQLSLCWIAASVTNPEIDEKDSLMLVKQFLNYQCTEEQVKSAYSMMQPLKRVYLQSLEKRMDSCRQFLLAEDEVGQEPSKVTLGDSQFSSDKPKGFERAIAEKCGNERKALLLKKLKLKDKAAMCESDTSIKETQKNFQKRMKELIQGHQEKIQEFHQTGANKSLRMERDHELDSDFVQKDKLKLLDNYYARKRKTHNILKDVQLQDVEEEQLAAVNRERPEAAQWLVKANDMIEPLGCYSEGDAEGLQQDRAINNVMPLVVSANNQESTFVNLTTCGEASDVCEGLAIEVHETVPDKVAGPAHSVELSSPSKDESDEGTKISLSDSLASCRDGCNTGGLFVPSGKTITMPDSILFPQQVQEVNIGESSFSAEPELDELEGTVEGQGTLYFNPAMKHDASVIAEIANAVSSTHEVLGTVNSEQLHYALVDVSLNCNGSLAIGDHDHGRNFSPAIGPEKSEVFSRESISGRDGSLHNNVAAMDLVDTPVTAVSEPSTQEAIDTVNSEWLHSVLVDIPPSCYDSLVIDNHDYGRSSCQATETGRTGEILHESFFEKGGNWETHCNLFDIGPIIRCAQGLTVELSASQDKGNTPKQTDQAEVESTLLSDSRAQNPSLLSDPFQSYLERMLKESEQLERNKEDMISQLISDREKEKQEIITQINNKYEAKLRETEAEFSLRKDELHEKRNKFHINQILAGAFRSMLPYFRPSEFQGTPSISVQQQPTPVRPFTPASACQPAPTLPITTPVVLPIKQRPSLPESVESSPVTTQSSTASPSEAVKCTSSFLPSALLCAPTLPITTPVVQTIKQGPSLPQSVGSSHVTSQSSTASPSGAGKCTSTFLASSFLPAPTLSITTPIVKPIKQQPSLVQSVGSSHVTSQSSTSSPSEAVKFTSTFLASAFLPAPTLPITTPVVQPIKQRPSLPQSVGSSPLPSQSSTASPSESVKCASAFSGTSSRPLIINFVTPSGKPCAGVGGVIRCPAPHLRSSRPPGAARPPGIHSQTLQSIANNMAAGNKIGISKQVKTSRSQPLNPP